MYICELEGFLVNGNETLSLKMPNTVDVDIVLNRKDFFLFDMWHGSPLFWQGSVLTTKLCFSSGHWLFCCCFIYLFSFLLWRQGSFWTVSHHENTCIQAFWIKKNNSYLLQNKIMPPEDSRNSSLILVSALPIQPQKAREIVSIKSL